MIEKGKVWRYVFVGVILTGALVAVILLVRMRRPVLRIARADFPKAQGPANAPIQIIEYSDFQCPACREAQSTLYGLLGQYSGKIRLVFQHYPLEGHRWSPLAHQAAECAAQQNKFWSYQDRLYLNQTAWSGNSEAPIGSFVGYAREESLELDRFGRCLADPKVGRTIQEERLAGVDLGVRSTPSFFVNGELAIGTETLRTKVERLIKR